MRVTVEPWSPDWAESFVAVRSELFAACRDVPALAVEHVGSTSVPGLAAKPVLDVAVVVAPDRVAAAIAALEAVGYQHRGDQGVPDRHAFGAPGHGPARHVYVTPQGSLALRNHLAARDVLRGDESLRNRYAATKLALATVELDDMDDYVRAKTPLLLEVLRASGRFDEPELHQIAAVNGHEI